MYSSHSFENYRDISPLLFQAEGRALLAGRLVHTQNIPVEATGSLIHCSDHAQSPAWCRAPGWLCLSCLEIREHSRCAQAASWLEHPPEGANTAVLLLGPRLVLLHIPTLCCSNTGQESPHSAKPSILPSLSSGKKPMSEGWLLHLPSATGTGGKSVPVFLIPAVHMPY